MKKLLKAIIPVFIISIALSILFIPTPAEAAKQESGYAIWKSEEAYLASPNNPDTRIEARRLEPGALAAGGFVLCYGDVEISDNKNGDSTDDDIVLGVGIHLTIDLNGHTLTASRKIQVNNPSANSWRATGSLRIRNGNITHASSQFIQPRPCSEIYLENLKIQAQVKGSNFITESGSRLILFKNCEINFSESATGSFIATLAAFDATKADMDNGRIDYVRNFVFEDTVINDLTPINEGVANLNVIHHDSRSPRDILNISFVGNSSFNALRDNFLKIDSTAEGSKFTVNIGSGARFTTNKVPIETRLFKVNYYDAITVEGNKVVFGEKTELLTAGEEQDPDEPKLIWGKSASEKYPYQLCTFIAKVVWVSKNVESAPLEYAGGVVLSLDKSQDAIGIEYGENNVVTLETHEGWSLNPDGSGCSKYVTLSAAENKFYAVFVKNAVSAVEYTGADQTTAVRGIVGNEITAEDLDSFESGAYVVFYKDMVWATDDVYKLTKNLTLDLGGKKFSKNYISQRNSGCFFVEGGATLTVKNGSVSSSFTSFATVSENSRVVLDGVKLTFDAAPLFKLSDGEVSIENATVIESNTLDKNVPVFAISPTSGETAKVTVKGRYYTPEVSGEQPTTPPEPVLVSCHIDVGGPFAVLSANNGTFGNVTVDVSDCDSFRADALLTVYKYSADAFPEDVSVNVMLSNLLLRSREVFDIGTRYDSTPALDLYASVDGGCYFTAKPEVLSGEIVFPAEMTVLGFTMPGNDFSYKIAKPEFPALPFNLSLNENFTANLYVPCDTALTSAKTYLDKAPVAKELLPVTAIDGKAYYVVSVQGINPSSILDKIVIKLSYISSVDGIEYTAELDCLVSDYLDELLDEPDPLSKKLAAAAINYIASAYGYCDIPASEQFNALLSDDRYLDVLRPEEDMPNVVSDTDIGNISVAFTGAQLYMSSNLFMRFNLRPDFSGTILVGGQYYTVTDGKYYATEGTRRVEYSYIQIELEAHSFYDDAVAISGSSLDGTVISGSYCLLDYVNASKTSGNAALDFILAFYRYCYEADVYENDGVIPPVNDHTPPLDVEWR